MPVRVRNIGTVVDGTEMQRILGHLDQAGRRDGDGGTPVVLAHPGSAAGTELRRMVVASEGRGQGLGRLLLRHLLEHLVQAAAKGA